MLIVLRQFSNTTQGAVCKLHVTIVELQMIMEISSGYPIQFGYLKRLRDKEPGILGYRIIAGIRCCLSTLVIPHLDSALLRSDCHAPSLSKAVNRNAGVPVFSNLPRPPTVL